MASGMRFDIKGLDAMTRGLGVGERMIADVWRDILRGPFGEEFLQDLRARTADNVRTGYTVSRLKVTDRGKDGVEIGIPSDDTATHPASKRANARSVGVWLESGTSPHLIPTKVDAYNHLAFGGRVVSRATHPGMRATRPMFKTLRVFKSDAENLLLRELDRRLGGKMNLQ